MKIVITKKLRIQDKCKLSMRSPISIIFRSCIRYEKLKLSKSSILAFNQISVFTVIYLLLDSFRSRHKANEQISLSSLLQFTNIFCANLHDLKLQQILTQYTHQIYEQEIQLIIFRYLQ